MAAMAECGSHIEILRGPRFFFFKVTPIEYLCKICCWYHTLNDSYSYLLRYYGFEVFYLILSVLLFQGDANGSDALFWIGLHKATDGQWEWASNRTKADYIPWDTTQPSNGLSEKYGCYILTRKALHDCSLNKRLGFMCEIWLRYEGHDYHCCCCCCWAWQLKRYLMDCSQIWHTHY